MYCYMCSVTESVHHGAQWEFLQMFITLLVSVPTAFTTNPHVRTPFFPHICRL